MPEDIYTLTQSELHNLVRAGQECGWDAAIKAMTYEDGTKVEVAENDNPYRDRRPHGRREADRRNPHPPPDHVQARR